jgi:hypothetical protein
LAEVGMRVIGGGFCDDQAGWAKGVEGEVEKAIGKAVCLRSFFSLYAYVVLIYFMCS